MDKKDLNQNLIDSSYQKEFNRLINDVEYRKRKGYKTHITQKNPYI